MRDLTQLLFFLSFAFMSKMISPIPTAAKSVTTTDTGFSFVSVGQNASLGGTQESPDNNTRQTRSTVGAGFSLPPGVVPPKEFMQMLDMDGEESERELRVELDPIINTLINFEISFFGSQIFLVYSR
jgi:hypothetical protein